MPLTRRQAERVNKFLDIIIKENGEIVIFFHRNRDKKEELIKFLKKLGIETKEIYHAYWPHI